MCDVFGVMCVVMCLGVNSTACVEWHTNDNFRNNLIVSADFFVAVSIRESLLSQFGQSLYYNLLVSTILPNAQCGKYFSENWLKAK
jgi:hypothetical protein